MDPHAGSLVLLEFGIEPDLNRPEPVEGQLGFHEVGASERPGHPDFKDVEAIRSGHSGGPEIET
ncbi:hypothetical protein [Micromonospora avicenniae]|uniref:hypothetical protein n=1 Tax=Micromonospora avicenniae TaxID=1198245 RepID=UPI00342F284F